MEYFMLESTFSKCTLCGWEGSFNRNHNGIREGYCCGKCKASLRYREQTRFIVEKYSKLPNHQSLNELTKTADFSDLAIYEPGIIGPFRKYFNKLKKYENSYYWPNINPGESHNNVVCQDLENLTYTDNTFDMVITSDILEHVRHPSIAFGEIFRVLKPGGCHIFTVPILWPLTQNTLTRVDTSTNEDVHIVPPHYHSSPVDKDGSLVYTDFGMDILQMLDGLGFDTEYRGISYNITFCSQKPI
jgi:SAM-dependent methyltransferase